MEPAPEVLSSSVPSISDTTLESIQRANFSGSKAFEGVDPLRKSLKELDKERSAVHGVRDDTKELQSLFDCWKKIQDAATAAPEPKAKGSWWGRTFTKTYETKTDPGGASSEKERAQFDESDADPTHLTRQKLEAAVNQVLAAVDATETSDSKVAQAVEKRRSARVEHIKRLDEIMILILKNCKIDKYEEFDRLIKSSEDHLAELSEVLTKASKATESLTKRLGKDLSATVQEGDFVETWEKFWRDFDQSVVVEETNRALESFESITALPHVLECLVVPQTYSVQVSWVPKETGGLQNLREKMDKAQEKLISEKEFWMQDSLASSLPASHLLAEGLRKREQIQGDLELCKHAKKTYQILQQEKQNAESLEKMYNEKVPPAKTQLTNAALDQKKHNAVRAAVDDSDLCQRELASLPADKKKAKAKEADAAAKKVSEAKRNKEDADEKFREALGPLADLAEFFPELSLEISKSMRLLGIPRELMRGRVDGRRIWGGCASWRKFAEVEDFAGEHRHKAMKVKVKQGSNEELFALKEYDYDGGGGLQTCVREAALLVRLRHQHVVKVVSVFVDPNNSRFYMQMPYYSNGSLGDWIKNKSPDALKMTRACYQALTALEHLHAMRVIHSDVKPSNIFVDENGRAYLGDLDVSVDNAYRRTTKFFQARTTRTKLRGFTEGFEAPEILESGATEKSDSYSFGKTLATVPVDSEHREPLIVRMTDVSPTRRPTAAEALCHAFFKQVKEEAEHTEPSTTCPVCLYEKVMSKGIVCGRSHFVCGDCLNQYVAEELMLLQADENAIERHRGSGGRLPCPHCKPLVIENLKKKQEGIEIPDDQESFYDEKTFCDQLSRELRDRYDAAKDSAKEFEMWSRLQADFQERLLRMKAEFEKQLVVQQAAVAFRACEEATQEHLRRQYPNALQCPQCQCGPVLPENCANLATHHGERRAGGVKVSNACPNPKCGFFSRERSKWAKWDGILRYPTP